MARKLVLRGFVTAALLTLAHWALLLLVGTLSRFDYLLGQSQVLRILLLLPVLPGRVLNGWMDLHLGMAVPPLAEAFLSFLAYALLWQWLKRERPEGSESGARMPRRAFLRGTVGVAGAFVAYGYGWEKERVDVVRRSLALKDLPEGLAGTRLVLVSDLHRGLCTSADFLAGVVRQVNDLKPDLVLLPGDFVSNSSIYYSDICSLLSDLRPRIASVATLGNHDHWEGEQEAREALSQAGVILLDNESLMLVPKGGLVRGPAPRGLCLAGVSDLWEGLPDLAPTLAGISPHVPRIVLSHNPDFAEQADGQAHRVDLQLSGHTHGGQVLFPGLGAVATGSRFGLKYLAGMAAGPAWPVYTTRGVGTSMMPMRVGSPPEITVFDLTPS